jgi:hypothetical protein
MQNFYQGCDNLLRACVGGASGDALVLGGQQQSLLSRDIHPHVL